MQNCILDLKGKMPWNPLDEIPSEKISISLFLSCLLYYFFHRFTLWNVWKPFYYFFFLLCGIYIFPFHVEAVPSFLVLFLTPGCDQQYLPLSPFFYLLSFSDFLLSFPFTSSLPLINPCSSRYIVTPIKIHFSLFFKPNLFFNIDSSLYPWFYLTRFMNSVFLAKRDLFY